MRFFKSEEFFKLNNGKVIPALGLGTFNCKDKEMSITAKKAAQIGYRLFDSSPAYGNENAISKGLWNNFWGKFGARKKYIIESKLFLNSCIKNKEYKGLKTSLENINVFNFNLSDNDLNLIDSINEDFRVSFHPDIYPVEWGEKNGI